MKTGRWVSCTTVVALGVLLATGAHGAGMEEALDVLEVLGKDLVSPSKAVDAAAAGSETARAIEFELRTLKGKVGRRVVWEVEVFDDGKLIEAFVDAKTGKLIRSNAEEDTPELLGHLSTGKAVSLRKALDMLAEKVGGLVLAGELAEEGGKLVWDLSLILDGKPRRALVHARTGKLLDGEED